MTDSYFLDKKDKKITDNLVMLRKGLGFVKEELADKIELSRSAIFSIENKKVI